MVIKVKRPGIDEKVEQDLKILEFFTQQAEKHSKIAKNSDALKFVNQFSSWTREELDLEREGLNAQILSHAVASASPPNSTSPDRPSFSINTSDSAAIIKTDAAIIRYSIWDRPFMLFIS
ncbi:ABC-1 domain-containing protein [Candidatus Haloredivivus sp. G17]|nr:ABC-1 domain-containing protein [Candidatus Haloredivivus sp. G17]